VIFSGTSGVTLLLDDAVHEEFVLMKQEVDVAVRVVMDETTVLCVSSADEMGERVLWWCAEGRVGGCDALGVVDHAGPDSALVIRGAPVFTRGRCQTMPSLVETRGGSILGVSSVCFMEGGVFEVLMTEGGRFGWIASRSALFVCGTNYIRVGGKREFPVSLPVLSFALFSLFDILQPLSSVGEYVWNMRYLGSLEVGGRPVGAYFGRRGCRAVSALLPRFLLMDPGDNALFLCGHFRALPDLRYEALTIYPVPMHALLPGQPFRAEVCFDGGAPGFTLNAGDWAPASAERVGSGMRPSRRRMPSGGASRVGFVRARPHKLVGRCVASLVRELSLDDDGIGRALRLISAAMAGRLVVGADETRSAAGILEALGRRLPLTQCTVWVRAFLTHLVKEFGPAAQSVIVRLIEVI
jgi:hypothetical protein